MGKEMEEKLENFLQQIAVENEKRFDAITNLLKSNGIKYFTQERCFEQKTPVYEKVETPKKEKTKKGKKKSKGTSEDDDFRDGFLDKDYILGLQKYAREEFGLTEEDFKYWTIEDYLDFALMCNGCSDDDFDVDEEEASEREMNQQSVLEDELSELKYSLKNVPEEEKSLFGGYRFLDDYDEFYGDRYSKYYGKTKHYQPKIVGYRTYMDSTRNIVIPLSEYARSDNGKKLVFMAHYDAVPRSDGANDNGSSIAILIAFALEVMRRGSSIPMEIVFTDREETGGCGSQLYSEKSGENILEIINLDTCGVGNDIITCDWSTHPSEITWDLIYGEPLKKLRPVFVRRLPYCDSDIMRSRGYDVMTICTLPKKDVDGIIKGSPSYTEVYKYMHNGELDSIKSIRYDTMAKIFDYLTLLL